MLNPKSIFSSKTLWLNLIAAGVTYLLNHEGILATWGLDADGVTLVLAALNIANRFLTKQPVTVLSPLRPQ
jgi:hypothetical protein